MGNLPSTSVTNAALTIDYNGLGGALSSDIAIDAVGKTTVLGNAITELKPAITKTGKLSGSYLDSISGKKTVFNGVVLQKSKTAGGFFLVDPPTATPTLPKQSGNVSIVAQ
jgi:hypothetical protein